MISDQQFLKDAHIEPCDIALPNWMTWREEDVDSMRMQIEQQGQYIAWSDRDIRRWKVIAMLGWLFAAMLFSIPIIGRIN